MRFSSSPRATPSQLATLILSSISLISQSRAVTFPAAPPSHLDFSDLGRVSLVGNFDAVSLYNYIGQDEDGLHTNGSQSLLGRYPTGAFADIMSADAYVMSMCPYTSSSGKLNGVVVGGNFTSLGNEPAQAVALYDPKTANITPLPGLTGQVNSVICDASRATVFVGGTFTGGNSTNAIAWIMGWTDMPFSGFNGPVNSMALLGNGNVVFGGAFTGVGSMKLPKVPNAQDVNVGAANISAVGSTSNSSYSNPKNIICKTGSQTGPHNSWLLADDTVGAWNANFEFGFNPTKLRLYNSKVPGYATKTFNFVFTPPGGIMNMTYFDDNGNKQSCTNSCPLTQNSDYQDFYFVNIVGMSTFSINILSWYGKGGGLGGIELFQNGGYSGSEQVPFVLTSLREDIYSFAIEAFNEPVCDDISTGSNVTAIGNWTKITYNDLVNTEGFTDDYLSAYLPDGTAQPTDLSVIFEPDIKQSGNYTIKVFTPGCIPDNTCITRNEVNITGQLSPPGTATASAPLATTLYQSNDYGKYDVVWMGYVEANGNGFRPTVTLSPVINLDTALTVVAQKVQFELMGASSGGLNGLYEYNPDKLITPSDYSKSTIDTAGTDLDDGAQIITLHHESGVTYAGGAFQSNDISNIMVIPSSGKAQSLAKGGLNNPVQQIYSDGSYLYVAGNFTNTKDGSSTGLNNVAAYSIQDDSWEAMGAGVNGIVYTVLPLSVNLSSTETESCIAVSGFFSKINAFDNNDSVAVVGLAIWVPSRKNWLENLDLGTISVSGRLNSQTNVPGFPPLYAGTVDSQTLESSGVVGLSEQVSLEMLPLDINQLATSSVPIAKRDIIPQINGASSGLYYDNNGMNLTIFGGKFSTQASDGSNIENLVIINGKKNNQVTGLSPKSFGNHDSILTLDSLDTTLFVGGSLDGGIFMYDLQKGDMASSQPPALTGGNPTTVYSIAKKPQSESVYVAGSFSSAGSLPCPAICIYDAKSQQWTIPPGDTLSSSSVVNALQWASESRLILAGEIHVGSNHSAMASYDPSQHKYHTFDGADDSTVPGPITTFSATEDTYTSFFAAGVSKKNDSAFLVFYDGGSTWTPITGFGPLTTIEDLQVMGLTQSHSDNKFLSGDMTLMVMGLIELPHVGNVSAALFDGKKFEPFIMSTLNNGLPGSVRKIVVQNPQNLLSGGESFLAVGFVVLISLAIALALTFLLVLAGIIAERIRRRREGYVPVPTAGFGGGEKGKLGIRAEQLLGGVGKGPAAAKTAGGPRL